MTSLPSLCLKYYGSKDLYEVMQISRTASDKEVRKAYHKLSLIVHPDRVEEKDKIEATEKFKVLGRIHAILSDKEKRRTYESTGECGNLIDDNDFFDWLTYWRSLFKKITISDISNYETKYKGSEEELEDLKRAYIDGKGSMDFILEAVPFTNTGEEERLKNLLKPLIQNNELPFYKRFLHESPFSVKRRKRKYEKEARQADKLAEDLNISKNSKSEEGDLGALIQARQAQRAGDMEKFYEGLAAKYAPKATKGTSSKTGMK